MSSRTPIIPELDAELVSSLKTFGRLYDERAKLLSTSSDKLVLTATHLSQSFCFTVVEAGKSIGCHLGGFSGGIFGAICALVWSDGSGEDATLGIVGSILGGVAGGALGGAVSFAVSILGNLTERPVYDVTRETTWLFGFAAGGVVGGAVGGPLGATGGAVGSVLGAFLAVKCTTDLGLHNIRSILQNCKTKTTHLDKPPHVITRHFRDFQENVKPLLDQLKHAQLICHKMASGRHTHAISTQTAASLDSAAKMEAALEKVRWTSSPFELVFYLLAGAKLSTDVNKELEEMRRRVETFLPQQSRNPKERA